MDLTTVKKLLENVKRDELIKMIAKLTTYDEKSEEWLLEYCKEHCIDSDKNLVTQKQIQHYWEAAESIINEANQYGGTYDEDEAYNALSMIADLAEKTKTAWGFRRPIVDEMMEQFYLGNSGFEDALADTCMVLCQGKEEKLYLADALGKGGDYYARVAASIYLEYGEEDTFVAVKEKNLHWGSDYIELANYYKKKKQLDKAIGLVEEALKKADGRMDEVYEWLFKEYVRKKQDHKIIELYQKAVKKKWNIDTMTQLMYQYYKDDYVQRRKYLLKMMEVCDSGKLRKWFNECKAVLTEGDFQEESENLYNIFKKRNLHDYLQLRIEEGHVQEAYDTLQGNPQGYYGYGIDTGHNLTRQLVDVYPLEICDRYWKECEMLCSQSNKKNYSYAVNILQEIQLILKKHGYKETWNKEYAAFLERHKRKSLLMGYIKAAKGL